MIIMRPVAPEDLDSLMHLATLTGFGLSTLPVDRKFLEERIHASIRGFEQVAKKPSGETYLLVMEDLEDKRVVGTSGIVSKVGGFEPFYAYRIETKIRESEQLNVRKEIQILNLIEEHNGPSEIGSLFLNPAYQGRGLGRLLSCARFLFMAEHPDHFESTVIAEMRGIVDVQGSSPFWEALGRHFFDVSYPKADAMSMKNKTFIADLMPRHPIYIPLLPKEAQDVIGKVHEQGRGALKMLETEGFRHKGMVDIFEAGAIVSCGRDEIRTVKTSKRAAIAEIVTTEPEGKPCLIGNVSRTFRACVGRVQERSTGEVRIGRKVAAGLQVGEGDSVRYAPARKV